MGVNFSRQSISDEKRDLCRNTFDAAALSKVEAEFVYRAMNKGWYGSQAVKPAAHINPLASPLYDSDDEPTEPSSVVNALAVAAPPMSRQYASIGSSSSNQIQRTTIGPDCHDDAALLLNMGAVPHPQMVVARTASAVAASAACPARTNSSSSSTVADTAFYPAAVTIRRSSSSGNSGSGGNKHRPRSGRRLADEVTQHSSSNVRRYSSRNHLAGQTVVQKQYRPGSSTVVLPLSAVLLPDAHGDSKASKMQEQLSLITNRCSDADVNPRPYHHLHLMQIRKHQHTHDRRHSPQHVVAWAQVPVQRWYTPPHSNMTQVAS